MANDRFLTEIRMFLRSRFEQDIRFQCPLGITVRRMVEIALVPSGKYVIQSVNQRRFTSTVFTSDGEIPMYRESLILKGVPIDQLNLRQVPPSTGR